MRQYAEYKDSGVEWIGEIPASWDLIKIKTIFELGRGRVIAATEMDEDKKYPVYSSQTENNGCMGFLDTYDYDISQLTWTTDGANAGTVFLRTGKYNCTNVCGTLKLKEGKNSSLSYLHYMVRFVAQFNKRPDTNGYKIMNNEMSNILIALPSFKEQNLIATYLDHKIIVIEKLILDKLSLIDLLKEKRQSVISEVVTKGLDAVVPMKDSEIEWIGEIPAHWKVQRFSRMFSFGRGLGITKANLEDEGIPCISYGEIHSRYGFEVNPEKHILKCVNVNYLESSPESLLNYGDFVFADTSEDMDGSGNFSYFSGSGSLFAGYHTIIARNQSNNVPHYLAYLFDSIPWRTQIRTKVSGIKVFSITQSILKKVIVILPPIPEQEEIVDFLDKKTNIIDELIADTTTQIEKLKEYHQSIISEVVTGKVMIAEESPDEKPLTRQQIVFKRMVLSAYILDRMCDEPTAGRVKFEKLLYLSEHCAQVPITGKYHRDVAGPYDPKALYAIEGQLKKSNWFGNNPNLSDSRAYVRLAKFNNYKKYVDSNLDDHQRAIVDKLLQLFKKFSTEMCEIVATLYGAWNDFLIEGLCPSGEEIIEEARNNWAESKLRINPERWLKALKWMKEQDIVPIGYGASTKGGKQ
jgi:type I restriction enzyme S subunit